MPPGYENRAPVPVPSSLPKLPTDPASVVTMPPGAIFRIVPFEVSATYTLPAESTAAPSGALKRAARPTPSVLPVDDAPARVRNVYGAGAEPGAACAVWPDGRPGTGRLDG